MTIKNFIEQNLLVISITIIASLIFLTNLGGLGYSLDEPQTVVIARTILRFGYPSAWDGKMFITGSNGNDFTVINGHYFWTWQPWMQFYLSALPYLFFGNEVSMLRFPFALIGVFTIIVFYFTAQELFKKKWMSTVLTMQLIFLMPFFLYIRQIRYYSPSVFLSLVLFYLLLRYGEKKFHTKALAIFSLVGILLFMTNYLIWLSCLPLFFIVAIWKKNKTLSALLLSQIALALVWFHFFHPFGGNPINAYAPGRPALLPTIKVYASYINNFIFPLLFLPIVIVASIKTLFGKYLIALSLWIGIKLFFYSLLLDPHGRYLVDIMPLCLLLYGFIYKYLSKFRFGIGLVGVLAFVVTTTNLFSLFPSYLLHSHQIKLRFYPKDFFIELSQKYQPPYKELSAYLSTHNKSRDTFWSNNYGWDIYLSSDIPMLVTSCDLGETTAKNVSYNAHMEKVKWFIFSRYSNLYPQTIDTIPCLGKTWQKYLEKNYNKKVFTIHQKSYNTNDPDIVNHQFPPGEIPSDLFVLYEKK